MKNRETSMVIENASVVIPTGVLRDASVKIVDGVIAEVGTGRLDGPGRRIDAAGMYVLPGIVDLHSDAIENEIQPRPGVLFPLNMAILEMDKKVAASGITTIYHAICFIDGGDFVRDKNQANNAVREISRLASQLNVRTRVHARFDIIGGKVVPYIDRLLDEGKVQLFSVMDHRPGQGQLREKTPENFKQLGLTPNDLAQFDGVSLRTDYVRRLVDRCHALGIPVASHDDDTEEKLDIIQQMKVTISEFPVCMEAAVSASNRKMHVCFGSPNVVRGISNSGNLRAMDAIMAGYGDILCSDYVPMSIIHAVFTLERAGMPLHEAVNMASLTPARAAGISGFTGSLEAGKKADLIIVDLREEGPKILKTFVEGREIYSTYCLPSGHADVSTERIKIEI